MLDIEESVCQLVTDLFSYPLSINTRAECLLVGKRSSYAYNLLIGKHGHHLELENNGPKITHMKKNQAFLNLSSGIYEKYYVISNNLKSQEELNYILDHSPVEYFTDTGDYFDSCEGFSSTESGLYYDEDTGGYAFYLPYMELSTLNDIYKNFNNPTIITQPDLAETIAHCVRKPCNIYNFDLEPLQTSIYTKSGYKEGELVPIKTKKPKTKHNGIMLTDVDFYDDIKRLAKLNNSSIRATAIKILSPAVKEQLAIKEEELKKIKTAKKK